MRLLTVVSLLGLAFAEGALAQEAGGGTRLLRSPTVSRDLVALAYAGDLWVVSRSGGAARRLTATPGVEADPHFSPDGSRIAFTCTLAGNTDVYVVATAGGAPQRLTYHPGIDRAVGWTPDGRRVVFASGRSSAPVAYNRLWTIGLDGGLPEPLPMPRAFTGAYSPDGRRIAYEEVSTAFLLTAQNQTSQWRHYRGGRTHPIRLMNLADYAVEKLPWTDSNDTDPMWVGDTVYFLSDRNRTVNLFSYAVDTKAVRQLTQHDDYDIMSASAGPDAIVYEQAGYIHLFDLKTGQARRLSIDVNGDFPWARPQFKKVATMIRDAALSPTGVRAAFEARGEIFTVPVDKGDYRNLTQSPGVHDRSPVWSPDGTRIAWLSDASGEYQLMLGDPQGLLKPQVVSLPSAAFFSAPAWSPDGEHMLLADSHLHLWLLDVARGRSVRIDTDTYHDPGREFDAVWAPDSRWVAYSKSLDNHLRAVFVYSLVDWQGVSGHGRIVRRDQPRVRRSREVPLFPRQHQLRAADRLARDELTGPPRESRDLSDRAERDRPVAPLARAGRRARSRNRDAAEAGHDHHGAHRPRAGRPADPRPRRAGRRLQ